MGKHSGINGKKILILIEFEAFREGKNRIKIPQF
jgi:hypothetical protein